MIIRYWNPLEETDAIRHQLDRIFDGIINPEAMLTGQSWTPAIEVWDEGNHLVFKAILPGVKSDDLEIHATRESVTISGQRHLDPLTENTQPIYSDIHYGSFHRATKLPVAIQNTEVTASFEQGILTLTLPKVEPEQNKVVKVSLAAASDSSQNALEASPETTSA
ncbi:Hsp20/alpha crystallin family protein [Acaryochloris marina NIES-2412]|uniref:Hsp20/alpha crystallin family protein n=1 Tax=Acaryochloris marina TaxID=155978 RepID=UPI00405A0163